MAAFIDISGKKYGRLTVIKRNGTTKHGHTAWDCICDCGKEVIALAKTSIVTGNTSSCGCLERDVLIARNYRHGKTKTPLYVVYAGIKARCNNPVTKAYKYYGGKGVRCLWDTFQDFEKDMGEEFEAMKQQGKEISIDRIDTNGNYCKENCRWATPLEQANNKTNNHYLEYGGVTKTLTEWAREYGSTQERIRARLKLGFTPEQALTFKRHQYRKQHD